MARQLGIVLVALLAVAVLATGQVVVDGSFHEHALAWISAEAFAVAQGRAVEIRSWGNPNRVDRTLHGAEAFVVSLAASPDGRLLAAGDKDGHLMVWEIASGQLLFKRYTHRFAVWSVAFSPDGMLLGSGAFDGTVRLWDTASWVEAGLLIEPRLVDGENKDRAHMGWVRCVAFSPDSRTIATSGCDGYVRIWDADTLRLKRDPIQAGINVYHVSFSPDGRYLAGVTNPGEIRLYRTDTWEEAIRLRADRVSHGASSLYVFAFSPDGTRILCGGFSKKLEVWDLATRSLLAEYPGHTAPIWGLIVLPDGRHVVTASQDNTVRLWTIGD